MEFCLPAGVRTEVQDDNLGLHCTTRALSRGQQCAARQSRLPSESLSRGHLQWLSSLTDPSVWESKCGGPTQGLLKTKALQISVGRRAGCTESQGQQLSEFGGGGGEGEARGVGREFEYNPLRLQGFCRNTDPPDGAP